MAAGVRVVGSRIQCKRCAVTIIKTGINQLYCRPCSEASIKEDQIEQRRRYIKKLRSDQVAWRSDKMKKYARRGRRYHDDPLFNLRCSIAAGISQSLRARHRKGAPLDIRRAKKGKHWRNIVGWNVEQLRSRLESLFQPGMTWANRREWHIDHIVPLAAFKFSGPDDDAFKRAWALDNLQPLWAKDNLRKSDKVIAGTA